MTSLRNLAVLFLCLGLLGLAAGLAYGLQPVRVLDGSSCGNGLSYSQASDLNDTGDQKCAEDQSGRQAATWGLLGAGIAGLVVAFALGAISATQPQPKPAEVGSYSEA